MLLELSDKILNHLKHGKSANGQVGCAVKPERKDTNKAWISISAKKGYDSRRDPIQEYIICYEIEYIELDENYDEKKNGMDFDLFLFKKENYYNIKDAVQLERLLHKWLEDLSIIEPISNVNHPMY